MADDTELEQVETILDAPPVEENPEPEQKEQPRDETGKFASKEAPKTEEKPEPVKVEDKPGETKPEDDGAQVPSWRLREVAEARRAAEERARILEAQVAQRDARLAALERPQQQEQKQERPDPLLDPDGYDKWIQNTVNAQRQEDRLNFNLQLTAFKHGEKFEKAFGALYAQKQAGNMQLVHHLTNQPNPGEAIVKWYSDQETLKEVGSDPASYKNKLREEALKDPEFLAKAVEAFKASAGASRTNNIIRPPSLSRTVGSSHEPDDSELQGVEALLAR